MFLGTPISLWKQSILWGIYALVCSMAYAYMRTFTFSLSTLNSAITSSGMFLINLSFAVSGTSYFWNIGKQYLGYRKPLGVVGFGIVLFHIVISTYMYSDNFSTLSFFTANPVPFIFSLHAVAILIMMVAVSNFGVPSRVGGTVWRQLLRIGYIAILFIIIHATYLSSPAWGIWIKTFKPILPPLSLITVLISWATIFLRIGLWISLINKQSHVKSPQPIQPPVNSAQ